MADEIIEIEEEIAVEEVVESVDSLEAIALDMGWTPKDKWRGDESRYKDANSYIRDTAKINTDQRSELKALKETTSRIASVTETLMAERIAERDTFWENKHREAVDMGDQDAAREAVTEMAKVKAPQQRVEPVETQDFMARNTWFNKDPMATKLAHETAQTYANAGYSTADQLSKAETEVRKQYPELFPQAKPAPGVGAPASRQAAVSRANPVDQLPPEALAVARDMEERLGLPVAKFAEKWVADNKGAKK